MNAEYTYPYSAKDIYALLTDPDFLVERSEHNGEQNVSAELYDDDGKDLVKLHVERELELPSFLKKMFHPYQIIDIDELWSIVGSSYIGKAEYEVQGQPVHISTETIIKDDDSGGCVIFVSVKAKASVPLVAKKVEKFICENFLNTAKASFAYITTYMENQ